MAAKVIAFLNFKGGVGKTAGAVNLAASLARYYSRKVLVVDLDPQCNSSFWLHEPRACRAHTANGKNSSAQIFIDHIQESHVFDFDQAVIRGVPRIDGYPGLPTLDLLPADLSLIQIEDRIHQNKFAHWFRYLHKGLKPYFDSYDYVFLDCPPNVYSVSKNALFAADSCIVPYMPDYLSLSGFQILAEQIQTFNSKVSGYRQGRTPCEICGIIINHYRTGVKHAESAMEELKNVMAQLRVEGLVHKQCKLLQPPVRTCAAVAASTEEHQPVCLTRETSNGAYDFYHLAYALDEQLKQIK